MGGRLLGIRVPALTAFHPHPHIDYLLTHIFCHPDQVERTRRGRGRAGSPARRRGHPLGAAYGAPSPIVDPGTIHVMRGDPLHQALTAKQTRLI